jgi:uncharacterized protein (TIGR02186 family)
VAPSHPLLATLAALTAAPARAETLIAAMSSHQIQINSNYTGDQLTVFGLVERDGRTRARGDPYDIIVTVRGPRRMLLVREKERLGPIWINRTQRRFPDNSVFLAVASNRPINEIMSEETARRERIGLVNAQRLPDPGLDFDPERRALPRRLIRILEEKGLYSHEARGVTFLSNTLFSAPIDGAGHGADRLLRDRHRALCRRRAAGPAIDQFRGDQDRHRAAPGHGRLRHGPCSTASRPSARAVLRVAVQRRLPAD